MEFTIKDTLKYIFGIFGIVFILYLTYCLSLTIAKCMNIENKIVPAISVMLPDMRTDIKIFSGLLSLEFLVSMICYTNYCEKIEINNQKDYDIQKENNPLEQ